MQWILIDLCCCICSRLLVSKYFDRLQTMFVTDFAIGFATSDRLQNYAGNILSRQNLKSIYD